MHLPSAIRHGIGFGVLISIGIALAIPRPLAPPDVDGERGPFLRNVSVSDIALDAKVSGRGKGKPVPPPPAPTPPPPPPPAGIPTSTSFTDQFSLDRILSEAGSITESVSPDWWVNSGAYLISSGGVGGTVSGELPENDYWRMLYSKTNPTDTDNGYHPQNIFRLVQKGMWADHSQETYVFIRQIQKSASSERNAWSGAFLFDRYQNGDNLYYFGVRMDGAAVIKKKINGAYYTVAYKKVFPGTYHRDSNPNLLPVGAWIGLRSIVTNNADGSVRLRFFSDVGRTGVWTNVFDAVDNGISYGGAAIRAAGHVGIRTDFMDASFDDYFIAPF